MARTRVQAVCGSCRCRGNCRDAGTLDRLRRFLERSRLAAEFSLSSGKRYRLGCERYRSSWPERSLSGSWTAPRAIVELGDPCD